MSARRVGKVGMLFVFTLLFVGIATGSLFEFSPLERITVLNFFFLPLIGTILWTLSRSPQEGIGDEIRFWVLVIIVLGVANLVTVPSFATCTWTVSLVGSLFAILVGGAEIVIASIGLWKLWRIRQQY